MGFLFTLLGSWIHTSNHSSRGDWLSPKLNVDSTLVQMDDSNAGSLPCELRVYRIFINSKIDHNEIHPNLWNQFAIEHPVQVISPHLLLRWLALPRESLAIEVISQYLTAGRG